MWYGKQTRFSNESIAEEVERNGWWEKGTALETSPIKNTSSDKISKNIGYQRPENILDELSEYCAPTTLTIIADKLEASG